MPVYRVYLVEHTTSPSGKNKGTHIILSSVHTAPNATVLRKQLTPSAKRVFGNELGSRIRLIINKVK